MPPGVEVARWEMPSFNKSKVSQNWTLMHRFIECGLFVGENLVETVLGRKIYCVRFSALADLQKVFQFEIAVPCFSRTVIPQQANMLGACWIEADFGCLSAKFV